MLAASPFRRSRLSWFRCPYCTAASYAATSRTIFSKDPPRITAEYKCQICGKFSTLRHPGLMNLVLPLAVATWAFVAVYNILARANPWYSVSALSVAAAAIGVQLIVEFAISRIGRRFDKT